MEVPCVVTINLPEYEYNRCILVNVPYNIRCNLFSMWFITNHTNFVVQEDETHHVLFNNQESTSIYNIVEDFYNQLDPVQITINPKSKFNLGKWFLSKIFPLK